VIRCLLPIVEGHSEEEAVPVLLRRLLLKLEHPEVRVTRPFRIPRLKMSQPGRIERALSQGIQNREGVDSVLVILDADDDEPLHLELSLMQRCREARPLPTVVVAATREFESWFLGSKESLRGVQGIRADAKAPVEPEAIRGAKERLSRNMEKNRYYIVTVHQPIFAARMDLDLARQRCPSFQRLIAGLERILAE